MIDNANITVKAREVARCLTYNDDEQKLGIGLSALLPESTQPVAMKSLKKPTRNLNEN